MDYKKYGVELGAWAYQALLDNPMMYLMFKDYLRSPNKATIFVTYRMSQSTLKDLVDWVAAEANHASTNEEEELLESTFEGLEMTLNNIERRDQ